MNNRFAALYVDDDIDDLSPPVEALPITPKIPSPSSAFSKVNNIEKKVPEKKFPEKKKHVEFRDFGNLPTQPKKNPFRKSIGTKYAFKDDNPKSFVKSMQPTYKFIDESVPLEPFQNFLPTEEQIKDSNKQTIIFSSTIGNSVSANDLTSLPL